ncbi:endonuclease/exonuclease/phosphatase family protein [Gossypium australe]|uniref:Endonuclease/exonuclease/phosphatase family protein n=1 Tax=Gossypium australe TaxID=47621 RepID=A0A5B6WJX5_9ROSI|nr:endonuclease/exonuclease/phosphatase family protein [Gossypium australe]
MKCSSFNHLLHLKIKVWKELKTVLHHEELLWKQKANCDWLKLSDQNTKFFHKRTVQRIKCNKIIALRNVDGRNIIDNTDITQEVIHFMKGKQNNKQWITVKIDLEKACDKAIGISDFLKNVIISTISNSTMQMLWNGVPTQKFRKVTNSTLRFVVKKIRSKLLSWDARQLSLANKATLAQVVLLSIPTYFMQSIMIPKGICDEMECMVSGMVTNERTWNLDLFRVWLSKDVIRQIVSIPPPYPIARLDRITWTCSLIGSFFMKRAYWMLREGSWILRDVACKMVWKFQGPQRKNKNLFTFQGVSWSSFEIVKVSYNWAKQYILAHKNIQISHNEDSSNQPLTGYNKVVIQFDSLQMVKAIQEISSIDSNSALIRWIQ